MGKQGTAPPTAERMDTPMGVLEYKLWRKKIRNLNLRVGAGGEVSVSAPTRMPKREIDAFLEKKWAWIQKNRQIQMQKPPPAPPQHTKQECLERFTALSDEVWPLFADLLKGQKPFIRVREMKTRWGVCNLKKQAITLNTRLAEKPLAAQEYVILHEYVHFLHPNHQAGFHAEMARLMPDYKARRKLLRE